MVKLDKFELSLLIGGKPVKEYADDEVDAAEELASHTVTRYVEVEEDALFSLKLWIKSSFRFKDADCLVWEIHVDGSYTTSQVISKAEHRKSGSIFDEQDFAIEDTGDGPKEMLFRFGKILMREMKDDEDIDALKAKHKHLGTIRILVKRAKGGREEPWAKNSAITCQQQEQIAHKVFKGDARSVAASFKEGSLLRNCTGVNDLVYLDKKPIATFVLKYRTRNDLDQLHILPREPTPPSLEERPVESLSLDERFELIQRMKADIEASKVKIKKERQERNLVALRPIKRSRSEMESDDEEIEEIAFRSAKRRGPDPDSVVVDLDD